MAQNNTGRHEGEEEWLKFKTAVRNEDSSTIAKMVRKPNIVHNNPLEIAVKENKTKSIETLIKCHVDPNKGIGPLHNTALHIAILNGNLTAVKLLINGGGDLEKLNIHLYTPFLSALENGNEEMLAFFVGNLNFWKNSLNLKLWVETYNQCPIQSLLRNKHQHSCRHLAALLQAGLDVNVGNCFGNTPILQIMYTKKPCTVASMVRLLAAHGAVGNYVNCEGISPLFKAVTMEEVDILRALCEIRTLEINLPNMFRLTPLFYAVSHCRNLEIFNILMKAGANPTIEAAFTMRGRVRDSASAMLQALELGRIELLELFFEYGFTMKRSWFRNKSPSSINWSKAAKLAQKVPTLKTLTRKWIKMALYLNTNIPGTESVSSLELPASLEQYISFV